MTSSEGVIRYAAFLFTRNQRRDFTAFVRPPELSNKDVSAIANAFNFVNDVTPLTADTPAWYCFPLNSYLFVLRHYDSGRRHAGRAIPVIEGIAIRREEENALGAHLAAILEHNELLNISQTAGDVESLERQTSEFHEWSPPVEPDESESASDQPDSDEGADPLVNELAQRYNTDWLILPYDDRGREMLLDALSDDRLPILHFAFGSNPEVVAQFRQSGITFDVVGYDSIAEPEFRRRDAMKAVDVREILPDEATIPSNWPAVQAVPPAPSDLAAGRTAPVTSGEPVTPIFEERVRKRRRRRRSLLRKLVDALLGR